MNEQKAKNVLTETKTVDTIEPSTSDEVSKMFYTMADAKRDFNMGYLAQYAIERNVLSPGWRVKIGPERNQVLHPLVDARSHEWRLFKTLDAAVSALEDIGFEINVLG